MRNRIIKEVGYEEAVLGFSLSYNTSLERTKEILPKYAFGIPGETKFLESIVVYLDITAPRFWWVEFDTYRVGVTKQSQSTMHTLTKRDLLYSDFEYEMQPEIMNALNRSLKDYREEEYEETKKARFLLIKNDLPEGFLQRRIVCTNYKTLQNMYNQRKSHRLPQWKMFCHCLLRDLQHPEFIDKDLNVK